MPRITFQQIPNELAYRLLAFASKTRMGRTIEIDGKAYKLDHISQNSSQFYKCIFGWIARSFASAITGAPATIIPVREN